MTDKNMSRTMARAIAFGAASASLLGCTSNDSPKHGKIPVEASVEAAAPFPAPQPDDCFIADAGQSARHCEGLDFQISVPDECITKPCGLITDVHGFGMNAALMDLHTHMRDRAGAKGYIVLQPRAPGGILSSAWSPAASSRTAPARSLPDRRGRPSPPYRSPSSIPTVGTTAS